MIAPGNALNSGDVDGCHLGGTVRLPPLVSSMEHVVHQKYAPMTMLAVEDLPFDRSARAVSEPLALAAVSSDLSGVQLKQLQ